MRFLRNLFRRERHITVNGVRVEARRAIDPATGKPFPHPAKPGVITRAKHHSMSALIRLFTKKWLPRQLLKLLGPYVVYLGVTEQDMEGTVNVICGVTLILAEMALSWHSNRKLKRKAAAAEAPPEGA